MNIVVVSCVFPPEPIVSSQTSHQIVEALVKNGHHVKAIVPFPSRPAGKIYDGYTQKLFGSSCSLDGYDLVRCWSTVSSKSTIGSRFKENFSFGLSSAIVLLISPKPDAIYSNTWPIFATGLVALIAKLRDIPLVISVQDLYPESLVIQNRIQKDGWIAQILRLIDKLIAQSTTHVIVISEEFAKIYLKDRSVIPSKVSIIPNWLKAPSTNKTLEANYRSHYSIPNDDFVIVYGGNIGVAAGVETLVDSFTYLKHNSAASKLWLIVAGSGSNLAIS